MNKIRFLRLLKGLTQDALAKKAGISVPALSNIENHQTQMTMVSAVKIAAALGVSVSEICDPEEIGTRKEGVQRASEHAITVLKINSYDFDNFIYLALKAYEGETDSNLYFIIETLCLAKLTLTDAQTDAIIEAIRAVLKNIK